jgi:FMN phosphatase YigB (HAD superfamily)
MTIDLKLRDYFDFVLNSYDSKSEKPDRGMFDAAVEIAKASSSSAYHLGDNLDKDVSGAVAAGWTGMRFTEWFDEELPDWSSIEEESQVHWQLYM